MRSQGTFYQLFGDLLAAAVAVLPGAANGWAQALHVSRIGQSTELVLITQPLSDATTIAWPRPDGAVISTTSGALTLPVAVEAMIDTLQTAPPVVVVVGGAQPSDVIPLLEMALGERAVASVVASAARRVEGGVDRRLGTPGSRAELRLEIALPAPDDWRRSTVEVLWELLPKLLASDLPGLVSRVEGDVGRLEARVDPDLVEVRLQQLRLQLARLAEDPLLDAGLVETSRQRVQIRRRAVLGVHPGGAESIARLWLQGGATAVREHLFGVEGVTLASVRDAARRWLPQHPGHAVLVLPPRVFNPRFAPGPERVQLDNDLVAAVLERGGTGLSAICLRPVLVPDVDGRLTATLLTRLAAEVRSSEDAPGWVRVEDQPPLLELAASSDRVAELMEVLQAALTRVGGDARAVTPEDPNARRRALQLMGRVLGLTEGVELSPAELLRPGNLAVGVVSPDAEAAIEALRKFQIGGASTASQPASRPMPPVPRVREATAGDVSVLVLALELYPSGDEVAASVVGGLVEQRARRLLTSARVELLSPLVPGRTVLLLVVEMAEMLDEVERRVREVWPQITAPADEAEIFDIRRRLAVEAVSRSSGTVGHARQCAAVAAGSISWRLPSELELELLTVDPQLVTEAIATIGAWEQLETTGAGVLPIPDVANP